MNKDNNAISIDIDYYEEMHENFMDDPFWDIRQGYNDEILQGMLEDDREYRRAKLKEKAE